MEKQVEYTHHYNGFVTTNGNYVWAGAMCLAWNQLIQSFVKQPIRLQSQNINVLKMIENYNSAKFKASDINPKNIYIKSGKGQKTIQLINTEVKQKFPQKSFKDLDLKLNDEDIISYAYLFKKLQFKTKFNRISQKNFLFNEIQCQSFYAKSKQQKKQIFYSDYKDIDNFTISISSKSSNDYIFFVKRSKYMTVQQVIQACNQDKLKAIDSDDSFQMPVIQLQTKRNIDELKLPFLNKSMSSYKIEEIFEGIKLNIDESGAKVENQAVILALQCMVMKKNEPKHFVLNKSFWVCMKQKNKHPYLCAYITNPIDKS